MVTIGQAIIFCHTRKTASWLVEKMTDEGHAVALLSGELTTDQRMSVLDRYRDGLEKILITTNVLSRGIDIEQVSMARIVICSVINSYLIGHHCGQLRPSGGR